MDNSKEFTLLERIAISTIWGLCRFVSVLPSWFVNNVLTEFVYFILYKCCRYRVSVVDMNLRNSFPEKSAEELLTIRRDFYVYLSEIMISTILLAGDKAHDIILHQPQHSEDLEKLKELTKGTSWVGLGAHYGLWEYFLLWGACSDQVMLAVYHPLSSKIFGEIYRRFRTKPNVIQKPLSHTVRFCLENKNGVDGKNIFIGLAADQRPPRRPNSKWYTFLNQDTIFFDGGEKIALKLHLPVVFLYQHRVKRGCYEFRYKLLYDGKEEIEPNVITDRYVAELESVIRDNPAIWLWSHRRWKHKK